MYEIYPLKKVNNYYYKDNLIVFRKEQNSTRISASPEFLNEIYSNLSIKEEGPLSFVSTYTYLIMNRFDDYVNEVEHITGCKMYKASVPLDELTDSFKEFVSKRNILFEFPKKHVILVFNERDAFEISMKF